MDNLKLLLGFLLISVLLISGCVFLLPNFPDCSDDGDCNDFLAGKCIEEICTYNPPVNESKYIEIISPLSSSSMISEEKVFLNVTIVPEYLSEDIVWSIEPFDEDSNCNFAPNENLVGSGLNPIVLGSGKCNILASINSQELTDIAPVFVKFIKDPFVEGTKCSQSKNGADNINLILVNVNSNLTEEEVRFMSESLFSEDYVGFGSLSPINDFSDYFSTQYIYPPLELEIGNAFGFLEPENVPDVIRIKVNTLCEQESSYVIYINPSRGTSMSLGNILYVNYEEGYFNRALNSYPFKSGSQVLLHEFMHSYFDFADEYVSFPVVRKTEFSLEENCDYADETGACSNWCSGETLDLSNALSQDCSIFDSFSCSAGYEVPGSDELFINESKATCSWDEDSQTCINSLNYCLNFENKNSCEAETYGLMVVKSKCVWLEEGDYSFSYFENQGIQCIPNKKIPLNFGSNCINTSGCYLGCGNNANAFKSSYHGTLMNGGASQKFVFNNAQKRFVCELFGDKLGIVASEISDVCNTLMNS